MSKCPKCEKLLTYVTFKALDMQEQFLPSNSYKAIAHVCPHCQSVLSVQMDPIALKTDTVNQVLQRLGRT